MIQEVVILIGMGFFLKAFFHTAAVAYKQQQESATKNRTFFLIHVGLGMLFIVIGRFLMKG